jgi:hypothetical protein
MWTKETLEEFLLDKQNRSVDVEEYLLMINYINILKPTTIIDIGTFMGTSGYILGKSCPSIKKIYSIDNINSPEYFEKDDATKADHGKYLPNDAVFLKEGYENGVLEQIVNNNPNCFVFWDAGKNPIKVTRQLELSKQLGIKHLAVHDTGLKKVNKVIERINRFGWYKTVLEDITSCPKKGVTIMELVE